MADSSDLALHISDVPTGSFTYSDDETFTPQEAIDRVNLFLLPEGFALIRSGKLLSLINLSDRQSAQQLDALAKLVSPEDLEKLEPHDVVKCLFQLGELEAEDAVEELTALNLMVTPAIFPKTNQLLITETVRKLQAAKSILDAFVPSTMENGTVVQGFPLEHVDAEDVLAVARPHLGLATGEMIGIDVSLSADIMGKSIFVTGVEDKVKLIEGLIKEIDIPQNAPNATDGDAVLATYPVSGGNLDTVYAVLQTLLAGQNVRLSADEDAEAIVALAIPEVQEEISATVTRLQASAEEFEVIPLKNVDPFFAISLIEQMLDLPDELLDDPETIDPSAPKIDADAGNRRLFVRAKPTAIAEIKKIIAGLEAGNETAAVIAADAEMRVYPVRGEAAVRLLKTAATFWRRDNPIIFYPQPESDPTEVKERVVAATDETDETDDENSSLKAVPPKVTESPAAQFLTDNLRSQAAPIRSQLTARGLLLQCDDNEALDKFVAHLDVLGGPGVDSVSPPVVFYLKYTQPAEALKMLAELLDGGAAAKEAESGSLVNGYVGSGSYSFSLLTTRDGTMTMINDTITVVAETRLNRLIAQGTAQDIAMIERYLKIIDKDESLTSIETHGTSHVIELLYTKAEDVAKSLREAYAGRVAGAAANQQQAVKSKGGNQPANRNGQPEQQPNDDANSKKKNKGQPGEEAQNAQQGRPGGGGQSQDLTPKMTIAVHEPSNSLIVTAPEQLFREVETLAKLIDERSKKTVNVIKVPETVPFDSLQRILGGGDAQPTRRKTASPAKSGT